MNISEKLYETFGELPSRRGRGGVYSYIKWQNVADRMNKTFGIHWSSEAVFQDVIEDNVIVRVKVTVKSPELEQDFFQEGYGGAPLNDGSEPGNPFKAAYSKALKDACKKWGVALFKDGVEEKPSEQASPIVPPAAPVKPPTAPAPTTVAEPVTQTVPDMPSAPTAPATPTTQPIIPATPTMTPPASPPLPPGVPQIVEETVVVKQEAPAAPVMEPPSPTVVSEKMPAAAVAPPMPSTPTPAKPATPEVAPTPVTSVAEALPSRPANVPLSPTERVKKMKESKESAKQMPTVPAPNNDIATSPSNPGTPTETAINNVQKVAIEGLLDMKGLSYDEIVPKALGLAEGPAPVIESLSYAEAIKVIRYVNDLYK